MWGMRSKLRRLVGSIPLSERELQTSKRTERIDGLTPRFNALDMAIYNIHVATRLDRDRLKQSGMNLQDSLVGDYLEFGVFQGAAFRHVASRAKVLMPWMRFLAFDSFAGLPEPKGVDAGSEFFEGQFACSLEEFRRNLERDKIDLSRVQIVPGWFGTTLTDELRDNLRLQIASLVFIDCDLYESCVPVLEFITGLLRQGSIVMFDDWFCFRNDPTKGVQRATTEWLNRNPQITLTNWMPFSHHGLAFITNIRVDPAVH